ncbi:MAG: hypothetical protein CSA21_04775 [Deltaproteobacteria bacterium]|nr:MAG: hypothetical protein CSA21_04775 [Deltaproteobacteria bacterium]
MRVSHRSMYANFLAQMNQSTTDLMDIHNKVASEKEINAPSDDPLGTSRILGYRDSLAGLNQYLENMDTATGWLKLADDTLMKTSELIIRAKEITEQASTGTLTAANRKSLAFAMRQMFQEMVSVANTSFGGQGIFAGLRVEGNAYETGLMVSDNQGGLEPYVESITGTSSSSVKVQFLESGTTGTDNIAYRYTRDGGESWSEGTLTSGDKQLDLGGGAVVSLRDGYTITGSSVDNTNTEIGTWLTVAPTAMYTGSTSDQAAVTITGGGAQDFQADTQGSFEQDVTIEIVSDNRGAVPPAVTYRYACDGITFPAPPATFTAKTADTDGFVMELPEGEVRLHGSGNASGLSLHVRAGTMPVLQMGCDVNALAHGDLDRPVMVRIDNTPNAFGGADTIEYSYSLDGGSSWVTGKEAENTLTPECLIPGGRLSLGAKGANNGIKAGDQFLIQPKQADIAVDISADNRLTINNVGAEIFGGSLEHGTGHYHSQEEDGSNLLVTMGRIIAALENNDLSGLGQGLQALNVAQSRVMSHAADVGARENRLTVSKKILTGLELSQKERMSKLEDADLAEVMTDLNRHEIIYKAVLTSSSRIMRMSLLDYI